MKQIAYITDIHLGEVTPEKHGVEPEKNWRLILDDIAAKSIKEIIFGGDIGNKESNMYFFDTLRDFKVNVVLGNHDTFREVNRYYRNSFSASTKELFYAYEDRFIKYIFLDSSSAVVSREQLEWLTKELKTDKKILLLIHHPILKIDSPVDRSYPLQNREEIKSLLRSHEGEVLVMCGHYHTGDEQVEGNIRQIITPAASYQIKKHTGQVITMNDSFGYRIIHINESDIATELVLFESSDL